ncbi:MAG: hypothetical protein O7C59_09870 [Rickettsia endosymbiont of Ixodes persulcatus]|nr:hypothetical protein [Rickettsia endosymbiont of Ixodes persulcatus]
MRDGSVTNLHISKGVVNASVMGSELYHVAIKVQPMPKTQWKALVAECSDKIATDEQLSQGKFSKTLMEILSKSGLFF